MKTVSRAYDSYAHARAAVDAVEKAGVPSDDVSIVANKHVSAEYEDVDDVNRAAAGAGIGGAVGAGAGLLAGLGLLAIPGLGPVVAAGWLQRPPSPRVALPPAALACPLPRYQSVSWNPAALASPWADRSGA
jgi:hypothetical protein